VTTKGQELSAETATALPGGLLAVQLLGQRPESLLELPDAHPLRPEVDVEQRAELPGAFVKDSP
jgi:hypothetical protein